MAQEPFNRSGERGAGFLSPSVQAIITAIEQSLRQEQPALSQPPNVQGNLPPIPVELGQNTPPQRGLPELLGGLPDAPSAPRTARRGSTGPGAAPAPVSKGSREPNPTAGRAVAAGGAEADAGLTSRTAAWKEFLSRPDVQAGLIQFSLSILNPTPGGAVAGFGRAVGEGLGAAGRVQSQQREFDTAETERATETEQQRIENARAERGLVLDEKIGEARIGALGRSNRGRGGKGDTTLKDRIEAWEEHFDTEAEFDNLTLDPSTRSELVRIVMFAEDEGILKIARAKGVTASQVARAGLDQETWEDLLFGLGIKQVGVGEPDGVEPVGVEPAGDAAGGADDTSTPESVVKKPGESVSSFVARRDAQTIANPPPVPSQLQGTVSSETGDVVDSIVKDGPPRIQANRVLTFLGKSEMPAAQRQAFLQALQQLHPEVHAIVVGEL